MRVGVVGATGLIGGELLKALDRAPWRPAEVVPLASSRSSVSTVRYGDADIAVDNLGEEVLGDLDIAFFATQPEVAKTVGRAAAAEGVAIVDCSGGLAGDGPLVVPWLNPAALRDDPRILVLPSPAALAVASVLAPLRRAGLTAQAEATVLLPASTEGRAGLEELSRQVVALMGGGTPPRKVFPRGLAFDLVPQVGTASAEGWTPRERSVSAQVAELCGGPPPDITLVQVPVFSGVCAEVRLRGRFDPAEMAKMLEAGGLRVHSENTDRNVPRSRNVEGRPFADVGRIRVGADATWMWVALDNLSATAAAAVGCGGLLARALT